MATDTSNLTIRLPTEDIALAKQYAKTNGSSVTEVTDRYLRRIRLLDREVPRPVLDEITGLLPPGVDVEAEIEERRQGKHGQ
ncbi:DUF6364 family protein [Salinisphaera aquimarina]|uniref:DUF6364 family protein n=1 Tax=Salinisphaera aquimarina TaxID=2094031 RepID=A0ABV7EPG9_9GAMM